ncbi:hypothetical protein DFQ26_008046 [Actinomortierella ambigua]|nr:hypothetical protein DFQ26_008046 [Actinomortierella ambigua]
MKRDNSNLLEHDMTMQGDDGDNDGNDEDNQGGGHAGRHAFKRARRPSFHDSTAPVRFESPEKETNSKSSRLSLEEQRVFGSGRVSRTRTTGGSGYEADLSSSTTPDTMDMAMTTPEGATLSSATAAASGKGRAVLDYEQGVHEYEEEDAGYDSRMSAATVVRSSETHRDTMRVSRIRPSLAESFEVMPSAEDGEFARESSLALATTTTTATLRMTTTTSGGANYQQQQQQQRQRDPSTVISSTSRLNTLKKLGRSTSTSASTSSAPLTTSMDDEATDFHDLHTDLPPPSTVTNYLRQGRSVSSTDLLSSTSSGAAGRGGGIFSRVSNLNLKPGGLKRTVSAMEASHSTLGGSSTMGTGGSSNSGGNVGSTGGALTQLKPRHFPLSLAEKRPLGSRRPMMAGSAGSSTSQLMSRLLKSGPGLASSAVTAADVGRVSSALQQQQSNSSAVGTATASVRSSTVGSSATNVASIPRSTTPVPPSSSSSSSSSTLMRPTESSLARAAELQSAKRSMLGGSTAVVSSSSSMSLSNSSSVKSKAPNPSMAPGLNRPQHPKAKTMAPLAPPPPPAAQPTVLPDIGSDVEDHDQDGDDPFPPKSSIVTVVTTTKGATSAASSSTTTSRKNAVVGSSVTSFTSSASASLSSKLPGASKSKSFTNKDASAPSTTMASSTTTSSKLKVEKAKAKPTKATTSTLPRAAATTTTTAATTTTTTTATTTTTTNGSSSASSSSSSREPPEWAQWNRLEEAMHQQRHVNPRLIFGSLPVLDMNDMFPGNEAKFRARSSSAHWGNADRLTESEAQKYREEMGWE